MSPIKKKIEKIVFRREMTIRKGRIVGRRKSLSLRGTVRGKVTQGGGEKKKRG